jgi:hypothetical protein
VVDDFCRFMQVVKVGDRIVWDGTNPEVIEVAEDRTWFKVFTSSYEIIKFEVVPKELHEGRELSA